MEGDFIYSKEDDLQLRSVKESQIYFRLRTLCGEATGQLVLREAIWTDDINLGFINMSMVLKAMRMNKVI